MFVLKDFVRNCFDCFVAQIRAKMCVRAGIRAYLRRDEATPNKIIGLEYWNYLKERETLDSVSLCTRF